MVEGERRHVGSFRFRTRASIARATCAERGSLGSSREEGGGRMPFELPALPYDYTALEPYIDEQTMHLHHDKHHQAYVTNLNNALQGQDAFANLPIEDLVRRINEVPENIRTAVRNNGGGHVNHTMFWEIMTPGGAKEPTGDLASAINQTFGSFDAFKTQFNDAG